MTEIQKQNIEKLRQRGMGYKRIASALGISVSTVKSFCQRNNLVAAVIPTKSDADKSVCKQCGKPLEQTPKNKPKTFCNSKCRNDYWNANPEQGQAMQNIVCAGCGRVFSSYGSRHRKYCDHSCYVNHRFPKEGIPCEQRAI